MGTLAPGWPCRRPCCAATDQRPVGIILWNSLFIRILEEKGQKIREEYGPVNDAVKWSRREMLIVFLLTAYSPYFLYDAGQTHKVRDIRCNMGITKALTSETGEYWG